MVKHIIIFNTLDKTIPKEFLEKLIKGIIYNYAGVLEILDFKIEVIKNDNKQFKNAD